MPPSKKPYWKISKSEIHNKGLFATQRIPKGKAIIPYIGEKITKEESNRRGIEWENKARTSGEGLVYIFELDEEWDIDGHVPENYARLINHSCEPNCQASVENGELWIYSLRRIEAEEELTFDYGYDIEHFIYHPCRCGVPSCPGFIVREDQRDQLRKILKKALKSAKKVSKLNS